MDDRDENGRDPKEEKRAAALIPKRIFDLTLALLALPVCAAMLLPLAFLIKATSRGPVLHWSKRAGKGNRIFLMPKLRTMRLETPDLATHLLKNPGDYVTPIGSWLRKTSLDEIPQIWSVLRGEMSWVGPRPALFNQEDLIGERTRRGIHELTPGVTGWAQIHGRDELSLNEKTALDEEYLRRRSMALDLKILGKTFGRVLRRQGVSH